MQWSDPKSYEYLQIEQNRPLKLGCSNETLLSSRVILPPPLQTHGVRSGANGDHWTHIAPDCHKHTRANKKVRLKITLCFGKGAPMRRSRIGYFHNNLKCNVARCLWRQSLCEYLVQRRDCLLKVAVGWSSYIATFLSMQCDVSLSQIKQCGMQACTVFWNFH